MAGPLNGRTGIISTAKETASLGSALITGAAVRIGAAISRRLHRDGYDVILHYNRSSGSAESLAGELNRSRPGSAHAVQTDLGEPNAAADLLNESIKRRSDLRLIVNNAAIFVPSSLADSAIQAWDELFHINTKIPYQLALEAASTLAVNRGAVVNIADIHIHHPRPNYAIYDASKTALASLTRSLALELAPDVRANAVAPGAIMWADDEPEDAKQSIIEAIPLARIGDPDDIAEAVSYLARAEYVTGQILKVDGGRSLAV